MEKLCKLVKCGILKDDIKKYKKIIVDPKFLCKKCGRVSNTKDYLCKPKKYK